MRDHKKLRAFALADGLAMLVYQDTADFPREEVFGLTSQMRRSAVSVASNIVEGCARNSLADYLRFLDMAYGSVRELEYQITLAHRLGYLQDPDQLNQEVVETAKVHEWTHALTQTSKSRLNSPALRLRSPACSDPSEGRTIADHTDESRSAIKR
jgi:four helix bundle protein